MRIGCLQFAPQVGDVNNNLNRADSVLNRASPEDLNLLVLPELAFTGYNFKSLSQISPFLEHSGSGISSLWARTTALKYNCTVAVGYPEKVDVSNKWPCSPEYYNSLIIVNGEGETAANYRKNHLYYTDETWALEGHGFYKGYFPDLGRVALGICMDINPYRFEAPWNAFEFAFHILEIDANVVILAMAWNTREDARAFSRMPREPDMETLTYWITRLEPLIRCESDDEIIVIFCNRCGIEGDAVYAGTSAVVGIKHGEVNVYGLLGRGDKELLVVDTSSPPFAKLVHRPGDEVEMEDNPGLKGGDQALPAFPLPSNHTPYKNQSASHQGSSFQSQSTPQSDRLGTPRHRKEPPRITIPSTNSNDVEEDTVPTPSAPSPTPNLDRPKLDILPGASQPPAPSYLTPHLNSANPAHTRGELFGGNLHIGDVFSPHTLHGDHSPQSPRYFWVPSDILLKSPNSGRNSLGSVHSGSNLDYLRATMKDENLMKDTHVHDQPSSPASTRNKAKTTREIAPSRAIAKVSSSSKAQRQLPQAHSAQMPSTPIRPPSPTSRNTSRSHIVHRSDSSIALRQDLSITQKLESAAHDSGSASGYYNDDGVTHDTIPSRKSESRRASRIRNAELSDPMYDSHVTNSSKHFTMAVTSPKTLESAIRQPVSAVYRQTENPAQNLVKRPTRAGSYNNLRKNSIPTYDQHTDSNMGKYDRPLSRTIGRSATPIKAGDIPDRPQSRAISRGRQRVPKYLPNERASSAHSTRPEPPTSREPSRERPQLRSYDPNEIILIEGTIAPGCPVHDGTNNLNQQGTPVHRTSLENANQGHRGTPGGQGPTPRPHSNQPRSQSNNPRSNSRSAMNDPMKHSQNQDGQTPARRQSRGHAKRAPSREQLNTQRSHSRGQGGFQQSHSREHSNHISRNHSRDQSSRLHKHSRDQSNQTPRHHSRRASNNTPLIASQPHASNTPIASSVSRNPVSRAQAESNQRSHSATLLKKPNTAAIKHLPESAIASFFGSAVEGPGTCGASIETLITVRDPPMSPDQEPITPKAMILLPDEGSDDDMATEGSESSGAQLRMGHRGRAPGPKVMKCFDRELVVGLGRPKSAVW